MNTSRIEIVYTENGEEKRTVIQPPAFRAFTGKYWRVPNSAGGEVNEFETCPLPTPKEQRAEKLVAMLSRKVGYITADDIANIEAIFAQYPDKEKK